METLTEFEKFERKCKEEDKEDDIFEREWNVIRNNQPKTKQYEPKSVSFSSIKKCPLCNIVLDMKGNRSRVIYYCKCGYKYATSNPYSE